MGYYMRVFAESDVQIPTVDLRKVLVDQKIDCIIEIEEGDATQWSELSLRHIDETEIALIEANPVLPGELGAEEIAEFLQELDGVRPESAVEWLRNYLPKIRVIYAFQILDGADVEDGWKAVHALFSSLRETCNGISQADGEGFANHEGFQITWQFSDNVEGDWQMAVLDSRGKWKAFNMNIGNFDHRAAFLTGQVPTGVQPL
jgi:hypothetical protein